jgi:hypothetical protein
MTKLVELKRVAAAARAAGRPFATADAMPYLLVALSEAVVRCLSSSSSRHGAERCCEPTAAELRAAAAAAVAAGVARAVPA